MKIPVNVAFWTPLLFGIPAFMIYAGGMSNDRVATEEDLKKIYRDRVKYFNHGRDEKKSKFAGVWKGDNDAALDELLRRGKGSSSKIEFEGPRVSGEKK